VLYCARAAQQLLTPLPSSDRVHVVDFAQYFRAAADLNAGRDPYKFFFDHCGNHWCSGGYIYPPLQAEILRPLVGLGLVGSARAWLLVSHILLLGTILLVRRALGSSASPTMQAVLLTAALAFLPLYQSLYSVQVGVLQMFMVAVVAFGLATGREGLAGASLAGAIVLRVTPIALIPVFVTRRTLTRPRGIIALIGVLAALVLVLELLTPTTWEYITTVLPRIGDGTPFLDNQSLMAVTQRAGILLVGHLPAAATIAALGISALLGLLTWLCSLRVRSPAGRTIALAAFIALMPIVSSVTWQHHLVTELVAIALLAPAATRPGHGRALAMILAAYPLLWVDRHLTDPLAALLGLTSPSGWQVAPYLLVTGLNLVGMLLLWLAALDLLWRSREAEA
jgi:hypothetical protein